MRLKKLLALKADGTYDDNFSIGDNSLNSLVNEINIREGSAIKEYDNTGANLLRTLTLGSATTTAQGFRYLDDPIKISNNATNPLTEIDISAGIMTFNDGSGQVRLATSLTKSTANDFANGGLLPNGAVLQTNTMYYVFAIYSSASNLVSFYADTSKTNPTLPTSPNVYDKKQYRGAFYVDASGNIANGSYIYSKNDYSFTFYNFQKDRPYSSPPTTPTATLISAPAGSLAKMTAYRQTGVQNSTVIIIAKTAINASFTNYNVRNQASASSSAESVAVCVSLAVEVDSNRNVYIDSSSSGEV